MSLMMAALRKCCGAISAPPNTTYMRRMSSESLAAVTRLKNANFIKTKGLVDGKWIDAEDGRMINVENPATGEVICSVPCLGHKETTRAISSAYETFQSWSKLSGAERGQRLRKWYDLLVSHKEELGQLITLEQGKPMKESLVEVMYGANFIEFYAEEARRVYGDIIPSPFHDRRLLLLKQVNFKNKEEKYKFVWDIVDKRWEHQMHRPLHAAALYLNPGLYYDNKQEIEYNPEIKDGLFHVIAILSQTMEEPTKVSSQLANYRQAIGPFGMTLAIQSRKEFAPAEWWVSFGYGCRELQRITIRVLSLTCSATPCERNWSTFEMPVGVVGAITPWNFPLAMITRKVGPALACGCTVIVKPSELTPLTALASAELALQAGIPPGAFNVVMGNASEIGDTLLASSQVRKITFTGSTAVGKKLMAGAAATVKKVSLELGGNAPCIVFDDADLEVAVKGAIAAKFRNTGQTCICANRVLVQEGIYDKFSKAFAAAVQQLQVGNGFTEGVAQGPLINEAAVQKVEKFVIDAKEKGASVLIGGKRHNLGMTFYEPTVVGDVKPEMLMSREEIFGPVAPLLRFKTEVEAIHMANDTNAGLAAYIFTTDMSRSWRVAEALEYGVVGVNEGLVSTEVAPFGGYKQSGLGREGSKYGMAEYLEMKYVCFGNMKSA